MIAAVLFDLDGTLLNRDASVVSFINEQYERMQPSLGHIPKALYAERFIELDRRGYVWKDKVYAQLIQEFEIKDTTWEFLLEDYLANFQFHCVPFGGLRTLLEDLKGQGLKLGIISNGKGKFQMDNIKALGIEIYFDTILISESEGLRKPDPRIFERAMARLNVLPSVSLFIGDHPTTDVEAAENAGMLGIWKKDAGWSKAAADYSIDELNEVKRIVQRLNAQK
ncbi:HAD family hydrolase [Planococcus sp. CP5-4]|uniref:HAD family hydrolase n=1 Tax=unclassified Planococcus (in: firmicutes) TaxID=2662419 RepID=UPI001C22D300|nr:MULTISPECIES: HAD family hydrolase [unclassified Planococcus (in: firmicutes)]MBU9673644.1 HAD family hydrolase [Planococcus sp. CP5-4_YE]MBV0907934.1 HAD family hydrolase [Planococcus sp. CP5-4_UN]MBW6063101.1 HAD family hydrolase [Planococcus sp. CP5-4]